MFLRWNYISLSGFFLQHFLGEAAVILPEMYRHSFVAQGEIEPILRVCLLDPSFHAFVEKVEGELRKLLEEWRIATTAEGRKVKLVQCVFSYTVRVGCAWWWWGNVSCYSADVVLNTVILKSLCYIAWRECCELSWIKVVRGGTHKIKRKPDSFSNFLFRKKILVSLKCFIVAIYSGPSVTTSMQVHFHCDTLGYMILKWEACSYSSDFCNASFQVIPQY